MEANVSSPVGNVSVGPKPRPPVPVAIDPRRLSPSRLDPMTAIPGNTENRGNRGTAHVGLFRSQCPFSISFLERLS